MPNLSWINESLGLYLKAEEHKNYSTLIKAVIDDDTSANAIVIKYNLFCLLMNSGTEKICVENLSKQLRSIYCSDTNIVDYVNQAVDFNPKLGYVSICPKYRRDMGGDHSLYLTLKVEYNDDNKIYIANAEEIMKTAREVLTMMLLESKTVCP